MMPPVSVCHQLSWNGRPNASTPHTTASGLSGSPTLARNAQGGKVVLPGGVHADFHHHADRRRRRVPDGHALVAQDAVPALGVEVRFVDDARQAVRERRDDAVGRAGHPAGIGRAPEDVVRMKVERETRGRVMRDDGLVHVNGAFRLAGRAAREVQQRGVLRIGGGNREAVVGLRQPAREDRACPAASTTELDSPTSEHVLEARAASCAALSIFFLIQDIGRHEHLGACDVDPRLNRLRPERGEERREHAAVLQRAERRDVELGDAAGQHGDRVAFSDAQRCQHVREAVRLVAQVGVGEVAAACRPSTAIAAPRECGREPAAWRSTASCAMLRPRPSGRPSSSARARDHEKSARTRS